jgi:archaellum component FlaC
MSFIKNQVEKFSKYLEKLKEQKAHFGAHTPPHILVEIDEIEEKIKELNKQIEKSERQQERFAQTTIDSSEAIMSLLDVLESIQTRIENLDKQLQEAERRQNQVNKNIASPNQIGFSTSPQYGAIRVTISGVGNTIKFQIGATEISNNIVISGVGENQTLYIPNVSSIILIISGVSNQLYIPRNLITRVSVQNSGVGNQIFEI